MPLTKASHRAGGLDLNYNCASVLGLASKAPSGSFDVCVHFPSLEILLATAWLAGGRLSAGPLWSWQGIGQCTQHPQSPKSLERDNDGL